ncbi:MAG: class I SAM-dependent methyltransferase [Deltaproteobacteria bacterium]|nr:class I SAM-dependent methyltransferase [Deltaproteobacteria bacterium]
MVSSISSHLAAALQARAELLTALHSESTTAYRLLHGSAEGVPGLVVDRYGAALLVQSFHRSLDPAELADVQAFYASAFPDLQVVYNDRSQANSRIGNPLDDADLRQAQTAIAFQELGVHYRYAARHGGQDPWLFLDLRAGRRRVMREAQGRTVLNMFAYTCGIGVAAAVAGASEVVNVDFAASGLRVGQDNAHQNGIRQGISFVQCDAFAALRQYAGLGQPEVVRGKRLPRFPKLAPRTFDLVILDPPRLAKSPFGVVDLVLDYAAIFKPAVLATAEGGALLCTNNSAQVDRAVWGDQLERCAKKAGRPIQDMQWLEPEADFPSPDGKFPLKMAWVRV